MTKEVRNVIVGFGKTGLSVANHCIRQDMPFAVTDDALAPARLAEFERQHAVEFAPIRDFSFTPNDRLIVSPGVPLTHSDLQKAQRLGATLTNDVQMFSQLCKAPFALITGSNGKSTVTHFIGQLLNSAGKQAGVGGNIGTPVLDLLDQGNDVFVIEASSYQLELADHCAADVAVLLNLSPDHLDRYPSQDAYFAAKANVFVGCKTAVINRETDFKIEFDDTVNVISFGSDAPVSDTDYGVIEQDGCRYLARGAKIILDVSVLPVPGRHNWMNVLAAMATVEALGVPLGEGIQSLTGLPHRCELVPGVDQMLAVNDSKSTNPASTATAIESFAEQDQVMVLLLGGLGKGADFAVLQPLLETHVGICYVYGQDRDLIAAQIGVPVISQLTLDDCINHMANEQRHADVLLFSPGCASLDQFANFEARCDHFKSLVQERFA